MSSPILTLKDLNLSAQKDAVVFLRLDLNVPLKKGVISDDTRIQAALPTLKWLMEKEVKIIACSHLGRPSGTGFEREFSLAPVGERLAERLGCEVILAEDYNEDGFSKIVHDLKYDQIILLENLRFHKEEQAGDLTFAKKLAHHAHFYVNDAFGTCHRADASMFAVPQCFPWQNRAAGFLIEKEVAFLEGAFHKPKPPVTAIFGGAKVSDKIDVLRKFTSIANNILIGGAMAYTFLKYKGVEVGKSRVEADRLELVDEIYQLAQRRNVKIYLPEDHVCASEFNEKAVPVFVPTADIPDHLMGLDLGEKTRRTFSQVIEDSQLVMWNGPMGVFEWPAFEDGTHAVARALTRCRGTTIVGGGDSAAAMTKFGLQNEVSHMSTGGGASLELLEGKDLPGLRVLRKP